VTDRPWEIGLKRAQFALLRDDPRLVPLLRITRIANGLTIGQEGVLHDDQDRSPATERRRWSSFLYLGALLHEGLQVAQGLAKPFRHLVAYRDGFARLQGDPAVQWLRRVFLDRIRDKIAFHADAAVFLEALSHLDQRDEIIFMSGTSYRAGDIYFGLADDLAMEYLVDVALREPAPEPALSNEQPGDDDPPPGSRASMLLHLMMDTSELSERFVAATHSLVPVALREMGWQKRDTAGP
jgi:hypothetical protein